MNYKDKKSLLITAKDVKNRMKISSVLSYCQEIADEHAMTMNIANSLLGNGLAWIITRVFVIPTNLSLDFKEVQLSTTPCLPRSIIYARECEISSDNGGSIAQVIQEWTILDKTTRRIIKDNELINYNDYCSAPSIISPDNRKVRAIPLDRMTLHHTQLITMNHIDVLGHVNNTYYADFITDCLTEDEYASDLNYVNITYVKEALFGDNIRLFKSLENSSVRIQGVKSNDETCFAAIIAFK